MREREINVCLRGREMCGAWVRKRERERDQKCVCVCVVYFDQGMGAVHCIRWLEYAFFDCFWHFSHLLAFFQLKKQAK